MPLLSLGGRAPVWPPSKYAPGSNILKEIVKTKVDKIIRFVK